MRNRGFRRTGIIQKILLGAIILVVLSLIPAVFLYLRGHNSNERRELKDFFESGDFETSYLRSGEMPAEKPLDFFLLTINGFSAFQIAIAQINSYDKLSYMDKCVWSLRKALLSRENSPEVFYVLGKAYYNKGPGYADLAVFYLEKARAALYRAADIPEYLGMAYAGVKDYRSSVAAFTLALTGEAASENARPSDILLLSIARSYFALEENDAARAYLLHCLEISKDPRIKTPARFLLGSILNKTGDTAGAEAEYLKVIEESGENAEAHYQLGVLYASGGDLTRARAEWRRAIRIDPAHGPARSRLN